MPKTPKTKLHFPLIGSYQLIQLTELDFTTECAVTNIMSAYVQEAEVPVLMTEILVLFHIYLCLFEETTRTAPW